MLSFHLSVAHFNFVLDRYDEFLAYPRHKMGKIDMNNHPRPLGRAQKMQRGQKSLKKCGQSGEPSKRGHRLPEFAASLNTDSTVNDAPPTIDLSAIEWKRVKASYKKGINQEKQLRR